MRKIVVGILAHVDAGKTTLAEAMLYKAGTIRKIGRVDNGDTTLDTHTLEKERGITIFAGQSVFNIGDLEVTLLDTPGHVDFSAETERMLKVLDYAILVISGTDGVQAHTRTLWKLLKAYNIPTFVFVTKMDFARLPKEYILADLKGLCGECIIDFSSGNIDERNESIAVCDESLLEQYLETGEISNDDIKELIAKRLVAPCFFGSGLKAQGVDEFLEGLSQFIKVKTYSNEFSAKVFKISHDAKGERLTHLKITGGSLKVKETVSYNGKTEKINGIRVYSGQKFNTVDEMQAGGICAVTGLTSLNCGDGLGNERSFGESYLEPVMNYRVVLPENCDAQTFLPKLRQLEAEDPQLHVSWNTYLQEIHVSLMGDIQTEILKGIISERFDIDVEIDSGRVLYKETIENTVEGVGHYEPLRHYAEVHLILEPLPRGSGIVLQSECSEDYLDRNWQNLILMHLAEKEHLGVLTGSPITDIKITLAAGRAHLKHTEGGDFRQSTYRAVRHGLMQAKSVLLEPYYNFRLEVPTEQIGRAINDIRMKNGTFDSPEESGGVTILTGKAPVTCLNGYMSEVAAYTGGRGRLFLDVCGYDVCHNTEEVIENSKYSPESDLENTPDSVFCAHGAGFNVKWDKVPEYMHIESCLPQEKTPYEVTLNKRNFHIDDKELEAIMEREFGKDKHPYYRYSHNITPKKPVQAEYNPVQRKKYVIVDGYNVIFAWDELKKLADDNLENARQKLMDILCNYSAFTKCETVLVFDAYKVAGNKGKRFNYNNIRVVYTKERELGDNYIEKLISEIGKNENVRVVTSDNLIQLSAVRFGVLRVSAREFEREVKKVDEIIDDFLQKINKPRPQKVGELIELLTKTE
ncbi:MAG: TetM/TetW/TetO/TetS family tetracycline resistance ribosomal protection protein [Clostridia bacterium]|nr:TetM/TetW/TetO/TetS family tetracycline resistance ribosomal protection protein [Clostridia bacterium]